MTPNPQAIRKGGVFSAVGESDSPQTNADKRASTAAQILLEHLKPIDILILDIETTGLNPENDCILEIAFIPAQLSQGKLNIDRAASFTSVIAPYTSGFDRMGVNVRKMHETSGLLADVSQCTNSIEYVETLVLDKIDVMFGANAMQIQLCGNSINFDRSFIKANMKRLEQRLSYRLLDVTPFRTLKQMLVRTEGFFIKHRALDDCIYSSYLLEEFFEALCRSYSIPVVNYKRKDGF